MDNIIVGDQYCKFEDIANLMVHSPVSGVIYTKIEELLRHLDVQPYEVHEINVKLVTGLKTFFDSIVCGLQAWRATKGSSATLSKLVLALQQCRLNGIADTLSTVYNNNLHVSTSKRFARIPEVVSRVLNSSEKLSVIKTISQKILCEWIEETTDQSIFLAKNILDLSLQPASLHKLCIVTTSTTRTLLETLEELYELEHNKIAFVTEQKIRNEDASSISIPILQHKLIWNDLTHEYQRFLMNKTFLVLQQETTLSKLLTEIGYKNLNNTLTDEFLNDLISDTAQLFPLRLPLVLSYYIGRRLIPRNQIDINVFKDTSEDTFVFTGMIKSELSIKVTHEPSDISTNQKMKQKLNVRYILLVLNSDFEVICEKAKSAVHWLHYHDSALTWVASTGPMSGIQQHVLTTEIRHNEDKFIEFVETKQNPMLPLNPVLLSDSPGMGKTILLAQLARTLSHKYPERIVILLTLEDFVKQYKSIVNPNDLFGAFVKIVCEGNNLSEAIMHDVAKRHKENCSFVEILIDGFDEVEVYDREIAKKLLKAIQSRFVHSKARMWITTRPHLLDMLENLLNVLGNNIEPFQHEEQIRFLQLFWTDCANTFRKKLDETRLQSYSELCLSSIKSRLGKHDKDIAGIPLQCMLIAEAYSIDAIQYCDLTNVINEQCTLVFNIYSITDLYRHLIRNKLQKYYRIFNINYEAWEQKQFQLLDLHVQISFDLLFPGKFGYTPSTLNSSDFEDLCNVGIVEYKPHDTVPRFIHRTFAEYFTAAWIVNALYKKSQNFQIEVLLEYVFNTVGRGKFSVDKINIFQIQITKESFEKSVVCFFIDNLLTEYVREGKRIPTFDVNNYNMHPYITASICDDCKSLFQLFTGKLRWTIYFTSVEDGNIVRNWDMRKSITRKLSTILFLTVRYSRIELIDIILNDFKDTFKDTLDLTTLCHNEITLLHVAVQFREMVVVNELLINWYKNLQDLKNLLHVCVTNTNHLEEALISEKLEILNLIYFKCSNIINNKFKNFAPLNVPNVHPTIEAKLLALGGNINVKTSQGETVLHRDMPSASHLHNCLNEILRSEQRKLSCSQLVSVKNVLGFTPLHKHVLKFIPKPETLKLFVDLGADFNSLNRDGESVIASAINHTKDEDGICFLLECGADINWRGNNGESLYHVAVSRQNVAAVKVLNKKRLDVNIMDKNGNTPLHILMEHWKEKPNEFLASLLAQNCVNLDVRNRNGCTALDTCLRKRKSCFPVMTVKLLKLLQTKHRGIASTINSIMQTLVVSTTYEVAKESLENAKELVQNGAELTLTTECGSTLLFLAMELVCSPIIKWLVESGLNVNSQNLFGNTPLHHLMSLEVGNRDGECIVFFYLKSRGALINKCNFENQTVMDIALKYAKSTIFVEVCKTMAKGEVNFCNSVAVKTLHKLAASSKFPEDCDFFDVLVTYGVDVDHKDDYGNTVLHIAAQRRSIDWVNHFLDLGANPKIQNDTMRLPIHMLYHSNTEYYKPDPSFEIVEKLLPKLNNVMIGVSDWIKLHKAACFANVATFNLLLADATYHNYLFSDDFVWFVMGCRSLEIISSFRDAYQANGFNLINLGISQETSALHVTVMHGESEIVEYLLDKCGFNETLTSPRMTNLIHKLVVNSMYVDVTKKELILKDLVTRNKSLVNEICEGNPPLLVGNIHSYLIKQLVDNGADVTAVNRDGDNIAHLAVQYLESYDFNSLVKLLFDKGHGFLFQTKGKDDCTVLHRVVAKWTGYWAEYYDKAVGIIKKTKADFNAVDKNKQSVLVHAVKARSNPDLNVILKLVEYGCLWSTLFTNVSKDDTEVMLKHLIFKEVDVSKKDSNGDCIQSLVSSFFDEETATCWLKHAKGYTDVSSQLNTN